MFAVALLVLCSGIFYAHRRSVRLEKERHARVMREIEESNERIRQARAARREKMLTASTPVSSTKVVETRAHQDRYSDRRDTSTVNDNSDMLTMMILQNAMNSSSDITSGTVRWDNDTPTITSTPSSSSSSSDSSSSYSSSDSGSSSSSFD
jgi:hypothetical protein